MSETVVIEVDQAAGAAYVRFSRNPVASTVEHGDAIAIDLDEFGMVVGIEILELDAELITDYRVEYTPRLPSRRHQTDCNCTGSSWDTPVFPDPAKDL